MNLKLLICVQSTSLPGFEVTQTLVSNLPDLLPSDPFLDDLFGIDPDSRDHFDKYTVLEELNRSPKDGRANAHGLRFIELCRNNNLFILNGRGGKDAHIGEYTFRDKSTIDYVCASVDCFEMLTSFVVVETDALFPMVIIRCSDP